MPCRRRRRICLFPQAWTNSTFNRMLCLSFIDAIQTSEFHHGFKRPSSSLNNVQLSRWSVVSSEKPAVVISSIAAENWKNTKQLGSQGGVQSWRTPCFADTCIWASAPGAKNCFFSRYRVRFWCACSGHVPYCSCNDNNFSVLCYCKIVHLPFFVGARNTNEERL